MSNTRQILKRGLTVYYLSSVGYSTFRLIANGIDPASALAVSSIAAPVGLALDVGSAIYLKSRSAPGPP